MTSDGPTPTRLVLAAVLAPAALIPLILVVRRGYLSAEGHWEKLAPVIPMMIGALYVAVAFAGALTAVAMARMNVRASRATVVAAFATTCAVLAAGFVLVPALLPTPDNSTTAVPAALVAALGGALASLPISVTFCLVARLR